MVVSKLVKPHPNPILKRLQSLFKDQTDMNPKSIHVHATNIWRPYAHFSSLDIFTARRKRRRKRSGEDVLAAPGFDSEFVGTGVFHPFRGTSAITSIRSKPHSFHMGDGSSPTRLDRRLGGQERLSWGKWWLRRRHGRVHCGRMDEKKETKAPLQLRWDVYFCCTCCWTFV